MIGCHLSLHPAGTQTQTHPNSPFAIKTIQFIISVVSSEACYEHDSVVKKVYFLSSVTEVMATQSVSFCVCVSVQRHFYSYLTLSKVRAEGLHTHYLSPQQCFDTLTESARRPHKTL